MQQRTTHTIASPWRMLLGRIAAILLIAGAAFLAALPAYAAEPRIRSFDSADAGVQALVDALRRNDQKELRAIFGPAGIKIVDSGDPVADRQAREAFLAAYDLKHAMSPSGQDSMTLTIGKDDWPFPVPLVQQKGKWLFDTKAGLDELLTRRIGNNELSAMQTVLAYGDAQREFVAKDRNGDGVLEYAQRMISSPGKRDGLYWDAAAGEEESPIGPLMASARREGYGGKTEGQGRPRPYHGYLYKILTAQGPNAAGGAYDYIANGRMIGGFGLVAYPAEYGSTGVMTFIINHDGVLYQKDLGRNTAGVASRMTRFDPDPSWTRVDPPG